jgi:hypothetical protein
MELCTLAKIVFLLSIISASFDVCIYGFSGLTILVDILFMVLLVTITNWYCEYWIAKGIVVFTLILTLITIFMCFAKHKVLQEQTTATATAYKTPTP